MQPPTVFREVADNGGACAGLEVQSSKWAWYWWLLLGIVADLILATIVYASYVWWNGRRIARESAALSQSKLAPASAGAVGKGHSTAGGNAPLQMTATAGAGSAVTNPYYSRSFAPAAGLQQPPRSSYTYPGPKPR